MLTMHSELERIGRFLRQKLRENNFRMAGEPREGEDEGGPLPLVIPSVFVGSLPHANFALYAESAQYFHRAPYLLVGYEEAEYGPEGERAQVLVQACAYTQERYEGAGEADGFPDNMGVLDVTDLMEAAMGWIENEAPFPAEMPYRMGTYADKAYTYPYAFGYLSFGLETGEGVMHQPRFYEEAD